MNLESYLSSLNAALDKDSVAMFSQAEWLLSINDYLPYVGIMMVLFVMFLKRFRTEGAVISSILHLYLLMFMVQIWSDNASMVFSASRQSVIARLIILVITFITLYFSCYMKKRQTYLKTRLRAVESDNRRLSTINEHLKEQLRNKGV